MGVSRIRPGIRTAKLSVRLTVFILRSRIRLSQLHILTVSCSRSFSRFVYEKSGNTQRDRAEEISELIDRNIATIIVSPIWPGWTRRKILPLVRPICEIGEDRYRRRNNPIIFYASHVGPFFSGEILVSDVSWHCCFNLTN